MAKTAAHQAPQNPAGAQMQSPAERCRIATKSTASGAIRPEQRKKQKQLVLAIKEKEGELRERAALLSHAGKANYEIKREYPNFCIAIYSLRALHEINDAASREDSEVGFLLFAKAAEEILKALDRGFFSLDSEGLAARFSRMRAWLDACSAEFGARSLPMEQIMQDYSPLVELFFELESIKKAPR